MGVNVKKAAVSTAAAGNTQDITFSGIGTPVAAMFFLTSATADNADGTHAVLAKGCLANSKQFCVGIACENGVIVSNSWTKVVNDAAVFSQGATTGNITGVATAAFITDGVRLTIQDQFPSGFLLTVITFTGDWLVDCVEVDTSVSTTLTFGFKPSIGFCAITNRTLHGASTAYTSTSGQSIANFGFGIFADLYDSNTGQSITQYSSAFYYPDGQISGSTAAATSGSKWANNAIGVHADTSEVNGAGITAALTSTGMTVTETAGDDVLGWVLAINFKGHNSVFMTNEAIPTSNTNPWEHTTGFDPKFIFEIHTYSQTSSTQKNDYGTAIAFGFMGSDSPDDYALGIRAWNNTELVSNSIAGSWEVQNFCLNFRNPDSVLDASVPIASSGKATFTSLGTGKYTKNLSTANASVSQRVLILAISDTLSNINPLISIERDLNDLQPDNVKIQEI